MERPALLVIDFRAALSFAPYLHACSRPPLVVFYPFSTRDMSGYLAQMKSTNARTFGAVRRLEVCSTQSSGSAPDIVPHCTNSPLASWLHAMD
ncbi:Transketolase [Pseudomonas syringae pv. actinidiae]|uniref:Transketolase n=1 Tax=Pseudomonas syringae pv. actinidiae TaxID=103796 RepID=A0A2V0QHH9_PSESF|nr:Transketolase [Pseudomonas syringae pv. actinidiae]